jgi:hypothetical protein
MSAWAAPSATLTAGSGSGNPGSIGVIVPISLASVDGGQVAALEFELLFDDALLDVSSVTVGGAGSAAGKEVASSIPAIGTLKVLVWGENQTAIGDGTVVNVGFDISASAPAGSLPLTLANVVMASPEASEVPATAIAGSLTVSGSATTFADVPQDHWAWKYIEALYQEGYVSGCSSDPLMFCPENELARGEMAVFIVRGVHGADFTPPQPTEVIFGDVILSEWHAKWDHQLYADGYTAGCSADPLLYCPMQTHLRKESPVYFERMLHGVDYYPDDPTTSFYSDVPYGAESVWFSKWVWAAYVDEIIQECEDDANRGDDLFRPEDGTTRAEAACIMAKAKALPLPE